MKINLYTLAIVGAMTFVAPETISASSAVEVIEQQENQPVVSYNGDNLRVSNANGMMMTIYNITGVQVMSFRVDGYDRRYDLNLPKGCYIVKVGKVVRKISVR